MQSCALSASHAHTGALASCRFDVSRCPSPSLPLLPQLALPQWCYESARRWWTLLHGGFAHSSPTNSSAGAEGVALAVPIPGAARRRAPSPATGFCNQRPPAPTELSDHKPSTSASEGCAASRRFPMLPASGVVRPLFQACHRGWGVKSGCRRAQVRFPASGENGWDMPCLRLPPAAQGLRRALSPATGPRSLGPTLYKRLPGQRP